MGHEECKNMSAHPEAKYDITESINSRIREIATRVLDLFLIM